MHANLPHLKILFSFQNLIPTLNDFENIQTQEILLTQNLLPPIMIKSSEMF